MTDHPRNLGALVEGPAERVAIIDTASGRSTRYADLQREVAQGAAQLVAAGLIPGQRVALAGLNSDDYLKSLLAVMLAGGVAVPLNIKLPVSTISFIIDDARVQLALVAADWNTTLPPGVDTRSFDGLRSSTTHDELKLPVSGDAAEALVLYTSGSTGRPKGVALSHASQWFMIDALGDGLAGVSGAVAAPLYHMNGLLMSFMLLNRGGTLVLMPRFDARAYLDAVAACDVTTVTGVPTMLAMMAREFDAEDRSPMTQVETVLIGSSPLSETVLNAAALMFPGARVVNSYGTTETGTGMFGPHPEGRPTPPLALGYPSASTELRLVGGSEHEGMLEVRTPAAMNGYLNLTEKTREKITADGFIRTGDVMRRDADGFFYFVGRDDDMFVCGGENIYPGAVERLLEQDPRIAEACVVPTADELRGQVPVAFVTVAGGATVDAQAVKDIVLRGAPAYMHPRRVVILDAMPLAGTNKIDRAQLARVAGESPG